MKTIFTIIYLITSIQLLGQSDSSEVLNDNTVKEFRSFFENFCNEESDTLSYTFDSLIKYKVVFSSHGTYIDPKNELIRLCALTNLKKENTTAEVIHLKNFQDSLRSYFRSNSCQAIKTCVINNCWGEPLADSMINIQSNPSFWASCTSAKDVRFSQEIAINDMFNKSNKQKFYRSPSIISYHSGKYLIVDIMVEIQIGNQTDSGNIKTYYLERID